MSFSFFENLGEDKRAVELLHSVGFVEGESPGVFDRFAPLFGLIDTFLDIFLVADLGFALFSELLRFQLCLVLAGDCVAPSADLKFEKSRRRTSQKSKRFLLEKISGEFYHIIHLPVYGRAPSDVAFPSPSLPAPFAELP